MSTAVLLGLFVGSYALTGVALVAALILGRKRRIPGHLRAVGAFILGFVVTIAFAVAVGFRLQFDPGIMKIHRVFATSGTALMLGPIVTGFRRWRGLGTLGAHRIAVGTFLAVFTAATVTGVLMIASGKAREGAGDDGIAAPTSASPRTG